MSQVMLIVIIAIIYWATGIILLAKKSKDKNKNYAAIAYASLFWPLYFLKK